MHKINWLNYNGKYTEILAVSLIFIIFMVAILSNLDITLDSKYAPTAIEGLTTITGVLTAFATFLVSQAYTNHKETTFKKWVYPRLFLCTFFVFVSVFCIWFSFSQLAQGFLQDGFIFAQFGFAFSLPLLVETIIIFDATKSDYAKK